MKDVERAAFFKYRLHRRYGKFQNEISKRNFGKIKNDLDRETLLRYVFWSTIKIISTEKKTGTRMHVLVYERQN